MSICAKTGYPPEGISYRRVPEGRLPEGGLALVIFPSPPYRRVPATGG